MEARARLSRREFVGKATTSIAIPYLVPSGVIGMHGRQGANDRITIGVIGTGGMGSGHVYPDTAALCDVDDDHLAAARQRVTQGSPYLTKDYRRLLDRKDIDAVIIATPDHWHAIMAVHACQAGKHVMSEKPTSKTIAEGRAMVNAARRYNRVVQIHAQGRSNDNAHAACQFVRNGGIGRVKRVDVWHPVNFTTGTWGEPRYPPASLDWEMWLGPARWAPYHPQRCHFNFRWFMDYGGGFIRDRGNHALSIVSWLTDNDGYQGRVTCEATGTPMLAGFYDVPATMDVRWEFRDPDWTLTWSQPGTPNPRMPGEWGATYHGDRDDLVVLGGDGGCETEQKARSFEVPSGGTSVFRSPGHRENWLECIRTGQRPVMDVEIGHHVVTLCNLGNISYRLGREVVYDFARERFVGDEEADRLISEPLRAPWSLS
ncbi:MAG: Gfo/Idh/MocA family oxidoreductase [Chthonomonadales bacterium]|nr:Gfo/Idh/MocA family oxidoreductase [Chthonomonadales bacterium]